MMETSLYQQNYAPYSITVPYETSCVPYAPLRQMVCSYPECISTASPFSGSPYRPTPPMIIEDCGICRQLDLGLYCHYYSFNSHLDFRSFGKSSFISYDFKSFVRQSSLTPILIKSPVAPLTSVPCESTPSNSDDLGSYAEDGCWYPNSTKHLTMPNGSSSNLIPVCIPPRNCFPSFIGSPFETEKMERNCTPIERKEKIERNYIEQTKDKRNTIYRPNVPLRRSFRPNCAMEESDSVHVFQKVEHKICKIYEPFNPPRMPSARPILLGQKRSKYSLGLEIVWNQHFSLLFSAYPDDIWSFGPLNPSENDVSEWLVFRDMAKVRFCCRKCTHGWTSMHGPVVFYYRFDWALRKGHVRFILTGQKCIECQSRSFETPMWYPEEAQKVMTNLFYEIAGKVYRKTTPPLIKDRRHGRPRQQHVASDCEGCHLGVCKPKLEQKKE